MIKNILALVIAIVGIGALIFLYINNRHTGSTEAFTTVPGKLNTLKKELRGLLEDTVAFNVGKMFDYGISKHLDSHKIVRCVEESMKRENLPVTMFTMEGTKLDEPIIKMHDSNPKVFAILGKCGFLELIGRIIAIAAWTSQNKGNKQPESLGSFIKCLDGIVWSNIHVWKTISDPKGEVMTCVNS